MTPKVALDMLSSWAKEVMPLKHIDAYNEAFLVLSKLVADAQARVVPAPTGA